MRSIGLLLLLGLSILAFAQNDTTSLADAAKRAREGKPKSKMVITEENFTPLHGPLPDLNIEGVDNADDVVKAIDTYRRSHTAAETEQAIREWYDDYDLMFQKAFRENEEIKARNQDRSAEATEYPDDYRKYQEQRTTAIRSALQDQRTVQKNGLLMARIQQGIQKVRSGIQMFNLRYEWMKIRFGNGNGSW